jgi:hypothetical protein
MPLRLVESKAGHREIADDAGLSLPTVKKHVHLIFRKLEVASRSQLIALMRSGSCTIYSVCVPAYDCARNQPCKTICGFSSATRLLTCA